ncbi:armadillo repeat-containing protein LFR [Phragmites australis]|uniref:armadillo repeat-containing protein LFR n=1 Tax=Phragmites australis TaxID=29695 RepID=UPI002D78FE88|nr:armadillo repeat-containing protein LFR [Phragmites australis]
MQKQTGKSGGSGGGTPAKRGRPFGSTTGGGAAAAAAAAAVGDPGAPAALIGPSLQVLSALSDQNNKRIVLALQSGLKAEILWALNALTVLSFKEKDDLRRDTTPLAKVPGLLDALLQVIDDWRDIAMPKDHMKPPRERTLGVNTTLSGFGHENMEKVYSDTATTLKDQSKTEDSSVTKKFSASFWFDEDGLFNNDDEGRTERQQCAVAASNIIRNFSFMPENETIMVQHRHCLETVFQCLEDQNREDDELITNMLETLVNLAPVLDLRIFSSSKPSFIKMTEKGAVHVIMGMLASSVKPWHCAAAELIGRLIINPDNESFLLPVIPQIYKRLVDLLSVPAYDAQAAAVSALYNVSEVNMDCRLKLASERWAVDRLLKIVKMPHPVHEVCRKTSMILESLVSEPQNRMHLLVHENTFAEILTTEGKYSDTFARILYELTARPSNKVSSGHAIWGNIN